MGSDKKAKAAPKITMTRFIMDEQTKHPEASGDFTVLLSHIVLACKFIYSAVTKASWQDFSGCHRLLIDTKEYRCVSMPHSAGWVDSIFRGGGWRWHAGGLSYEFCRNGSPFNAFSPWNISYRLKIKRSWKILPMMFSQEPSSAAVAV